MEVSKEPISLRVSRLNAQICKNSNSLTGISRDSLFDALVVLYEECNSEALKRKDAHIAKFVNKYHSIISSLKKNRVNISDFDVKKVIGRGQFGEVHLVIERQTNDIYAMKTIRKSDSLKHQFSSYEEERDIMILTKSPWLTSLKYAFQDIGHLYLVMEFHPGGDLYGLLDRQGGKMFEAHAKFYVSEVVQAIHALHSMGYVHRDIKPENILLDRFGHVKLADFGSAAKLGPDNIVVDKDEIAIGTPDYIAVEVLQANEKSKDIKVTYGCCCDYWSLGVLAYELTIGHTPFADTNTTITYSKIMNYASSLKFPSCNLSEEYMELVKALITDQQSRLSYVEITHHELFKDTDWATLRDQIPPFIPNLSTVDDTSNFLNVEAKKSCPSIENFKIRTQFSGRNLPFVGFTYTNGVNGKDISPSKAIEGELLEKKREQVTSLTCQLAKAEHATSDFAKDYAELQQQLEDSMRKVVNMEAVRGNLERDLAARNSEAAALRRTLELERLEREEVEIRAVDIIQSAKLKWECDERKHLTQLNEELQMHMNRISELSAANNDLTSKLQHFEICISESNKQIKRLQSVALAHKESLKKVCEFKKQSKTNAEIQEQQYKEAAKQKIKELQTKIEEFSKLNDALEKKIKAYMIREAQLQKDCIRTLEEYNNLKIMYEKSEEKCRQLEIKITELTYEVEQIDKLRAKLEEYKTQVENMKSDDKTVLYEEALKYHMRECESLRREIMSATVSHEHELAAEKAIYLERKFAFESDKKIMEENLNDAFKQLEQLSKTLEESKQKEIETDAKVETLQIQLSHLKDTKCETNTKKEVFLQEQVDRLEDKIKDLHKINTLEKLEHRSTTVKLWRKDKELFTCQVDKNIAERELKTVDKKLTKLLEDLQKTTNQKVQMESQHDNELIKLSQANDELEAKIEVLLQQIKDLETNIDIYKTNYEAERNNIALITMKLDKATENANDLNMKLETEITTKNNLINEVENVRLDNVKLHYNLDLSKQRENIAKEEVVKYKQALEDATINNNSLKEACSMLERQLKLCEQVMSRQDVKEKQLEDEILKLKSDLDNALAEVKKFSDMADAERLAKLGLDTRCLKLQKKLDLLKVESSSYKTHLAEYTDVLRETYTEMSQLDKDYREVTVSETVLKRQINDLNTELYRSKKESGKRLTAIQHLREANYKLHQEIRCLWGDNNVFVIRLAEQDSYLEEVEAYYKERELKTLSTIQQQTKLIDFLQTKLQDIYKKKKGLSSVLFGYKKDNAQQPVNYRPADKLSHEPLKDIKNVAKKENVPSKHITTETKSLPQMPFTSESYRNPHRFVSRISQKSVKCAGCPDILQLTSNISVCCKCGISVHVQCAQNVLNISCIPKNSTDTKEGFNEIDEDEKARSQNIRMEGWIKVQNQNTKEWQKRYARLEDTVLAVYEQEPSGNVSPLTKLQLCPNDGWSTVCDALLAEDLEDIDNSDVPLVIRIDIHLLAAWWSTNSYFILALNETDKENWLIALCALLLRKVKAPRKNYFDVVITLDTKVEPICIKELSKDIFLIGCEEGLYASQRGNSILHIQGPTCIDQMTILDSLNMVIMIAGISRNLIKTELYNLISLAQCAPCTEPTLKHKLMSNEDGFHMFEVFEVKDNTYLAAAANNKLFLFKHDFKTNDFNLLREFYTTGPTNCVLSRGQSLIVAAEKLFKINLKTLAADEFLDTSENKLVEVFECYKRQSFVRAIILVNNDPCEYLLCFNEFGIFINEFGQRSREGDLKWMHLPVAFSYCAPFLFLVQFTDVEIIRLTPEMGKEVGTENWINVESKRLELCKPRLLGQNNTGIYLSIQNEIVHLNAKLIMDDDSPEDSEQLACTDEANNSDMETEFSFTSSIIKSLDGATQED